MSWRSQCGATASRLNRFIALLPLIAVDPKLVTTFVIPVWSPETKPPNTGMPLPKFWVETPTVPFEETLEK